ncbi:MAG: cellulase family glycosylhydrolase [Planctomycetota bacterium]
MMALSLTTGCMEGLSRSGSRTQWSEQKAWDWYDNQPWMVGCNYLPATACNQLEMWQAETFDPETIDRELGWAEDLGFNVIRVFLHDMMWAQDAEGFVKRIDQVLAIADDHNIKVMPILFDSCWNPLPKLGPQEIAQKHLHNSSWVQSPHRDTLTDMEQWPKLKEYVQGIVKRYRNDDRVLIWDVYNEPGNPNVPAYEKVETPHKGEYSLLLMKNAFEWIREMNPKQPLMASVWVGDWKKGNDIPALNQFALTQSDINQFHVYHGPDVTRDWIKILQEYNRPIVCGEYMARTVGCTFDGLLPIFKEHKIAAINWGFVAGRSQTNYPWESWNKEFTAEPEVWFHDILRPDGTPFDVKEVEFIKNIIKDE